MAKLNGDPDASTRIQFGPGVWADVDYGNARILLNGEVWALLLGLIGAFVTGALLDIGFLGFVVGYGSFGVLGKIIGISLALRSKSRRLKKANGR